MAEYLDRQTLDQFDRENRELDNFLYRTRMRREQEQPEPEPEPQPVSLAQINAQRSADWHAWAEEKIEAAIEEHDRHLTAHHNTMVADIERGTDAIFAELDALEGRT